ncbi:AAA family ATPase [Streptomyces roseifaciens]|uniref:AAA family ATPase n=1 Tax=Streptomyces roseifaciens TaxID=1488406 RepID=UPI00071808EE|nr:AAA family ATPase [Streptomyces roseifaciens]
MIDSSWDVLLLGGASGVGKSRAAARLARSSGAFVVEFDDVVSAVQRLTTVEQHPGLHCFDGIPDTSVLDVDRVVELQIATADALQPALLGVVDNRLTIDVPAVIEGDYLTPAAAARAVEEGAVIGRDIRAVFLHEDDPEQITANYAAREPNSGLQTHRAQVSARYSQWLADQAALHGVPVVPCRPWHDVAVRIERALGRAASQS